jgi:hypothetical protein
MKKITALALSLLMFATLASCVADDTPDEPSGSTPPLGEQQNNTPPDEPQDNTPPDTQQTWTPDPELPGTVAVNITTVQYMVDAPTTLFGRAGSGYRSPYGDDIFVIYGEYVNRSSEERNGVTIDEITKASDVFISMEPQICFSIGSALTFADQKELIIEKSEDVTINGWDMCRYEGEMKLSNSNHKISWDSVKFVGYGIIKDGCPVFFVVVDGTKDQTATGLGELADKIAKTFREYEVIRD